MLNLDLGVARALSATLAAAGLDTSQVTPDKVIAGVAYLKTRFEEARLESNDEEACWSRAFQDLKRWSLATI